MQRSLKHEYEIFVQEEIDFYKDSLPRATLLSIGDEAVSILHRADQLSLSELMLTEEVDRLIRARLRLPSFAVWKRRRLKMIDRYRSPEHWNLSPDHVLMREVRIASEGHILFASPSRDGFPLFLAANGCDVTAVDEEAGVVRRVLSAASAAGLAVRGYVAQLGEWSPDVLLTAVICTDAAFARLSSLERRRAIEVLQGATLAGGVHLVEASTENGETVNFDELRSNYLGWQVTIDGGGPDSLPVFIARKSAA